MDVTADRCFNGQVLHKTGVLADRCYNRQMLQQTNVREDRCYSSMVICTFQRVMVTFVYQNCGC